MIIIRLFFGIQTPHGLMINIRELPILQRTLVDIRPFQQMSRIARLMAPIYIDCQDSLEVPALKDSQLSTLLRFALWLGTSNTSTVAIHQCTT
jgi:hypothetical protein